MFNLGHEIGRNTVARILKDAGLQPAPERRRQPRWKEFLKAHFCEMAATDFFTVEVLTAFGLVRYWVMLVIELGSRRVHIAGITHSPHAGWTEQIARNLTDPVDGFLKNIRYLIHDRDALFTVRFAEILKSAGVEGIKLTARSPNLNAYAERFVRSIRIECLDRIVPLGERHLRHIVSQYVEHFLLERNHQGLGNRLITGPPSANSNAGHPVQCRERLGGLLKFYHRDVASFYSIWFWDNTASCTT